MNKFNPTLSTRLNLAFSFVPVVLALVVGVSTWSTQKTSASVDIMVDKVMQKERLVAEWAANTNINGARTLAMGDLSNADRIKDIQARTKATSARISEIQKQLEAFEQSAEEKAMFDQIAAQRKTYMTARDEVLKMKSVNEEEAHKMQVSKLEPAMSSYIDSITKLAQHQAEQTKEIRSEITRDTERSKHFLWILGLIGAALGISVSFITARNVKSQIGGEPAAAVEAANQIASGNLRANIDVANDDTRSLMFAMKSMQESLLRIVAEVRTSTSTINTAAQEIASGNSDLSARTEQQASALEETASSMEELTSTVRQNADNAKQANTLVSESSMVASKGGKVVQKVVVTMDEISASSKKIVEIISVIDSIAFQTNILALNAAVEAARAGEQGRGFAVVATEVRNLAHRSSAAAKEIKDLIDTSANTVAEGAHLVSEAGRTMQEIVDSVSRVQHLMSDIAAASNEQTAGIEQVNQAISQMDQTTQQNAALVEQSASGASSLKEQAKKLAETVDVFRV